MIVKGFDKSSVDLSMSFDCSLKSMRRILDEKLRLDNGNETGLLRDGSKSSESLDIEINSESAGSSVGDGE